MGTSPSPFTVCLPPAGTSPTVSRLPFPGRRLQGNRAAAAGTSPTASRLSMAFPRSRRAGAFRDACLFLLNCTSRLLQPPTSETLGRQHVPQGASHMHQRTSQYMFAPRPQTVLPRSFPHPLPRCLTVFQPSFRILCLGLKRLVRANLRRFCFGLKGFINEASRSCIGL